MGEEPRGFILRHLKNRRREIEEHNLLMVVPKHSRGLLKPIIRDMVAKGEVSFRVSGNRKLYRIK